VTDLFVADADRLTDQQIEIFDDVLGHLIKRIESQALAEISRSGPPPSPRGRYRGPPSRLSERDLIEIASTTTQAHLLAISTRPQIGAVVTDVLLRHGHKDVFRALAENPGAQFSTRGFEALVRHAKSEAPLTEKIGLWLDVPLKLSGNCAGDACDGSAPLEAISHSFRNR